MSDKISVLKEDQSPYPEIEKRYLAFMHDICVRLRYIDLYITKHPPQANFRKIWLESMCLQLRMICENIAMATLVANYKDYNYRKKDIGSFYQPHAIKEMLSYINPNHYPLPFVVGANFEEKKKRAVEKKDFSLSHDELLQLWVDTSEILHCRNPFKKTPQKMFSEESIIKYCGRIRYFIAMHVVVLKNFENKGFLVTVDIFTHKDHRMNYINNINLITSI
ncbi:MAG: hypothetical protein ABIQ88_02450 [Chitinophagaceae bacterium]